MKLLEWSLVKYRIFRQCRIMSSPGFTPGISPFYYNCDILIHQCIAYIVNIIRLFCGLILMSEFQVQTVILQDWDIISCICMSSSNDASLKWILRGTVCGEVSVLMHSHVVCVRVHVRKCVVGFFAMYTCGFKRQKSTLKFGHKAIEHQLWKLNSEFHIWYKFRFQAVIIKQCHANSVEGVIIS